MIAHCDLEIGTEIITHDAVEEKPAEGRLRRVLILLLVVSLCMATTTLFAWHWHERTATMMKDHKPTSMHMLTGTTDFHQTLRQKSKFKAAIHLEGEYNPYIITDAVEWRKDEGQAFSQGGFDLTENQVIIPHTGLYFVYSQASYRFKCTNLKDYMDKSIPPLSHIIWRHSDSITGDAYLLSAVRSVCQRAIDDRTYNIGEGQYNAIYLGAVFQLNKGDRLWTETKRLTDLESGEGKTYFGMFAL